MLRNLGDAMRSVVERHHAVIRRIARQMADEMAAKPDAGSVEAPRPTAAERRKQAAFARRQARYEQAERLLADGLPLRDAATRIGVDPRTCGDGARSAMRPCGTAAPAAASWTRSGPTWSVAGPRGAATPASSGASWSAGFAGRPSIVRVWTGRRRKAEAAAGVPSPGASAEITPMEAAVPSPAHAPAHRRSR